MYNIELNYFDPRDDVKQAFQDCITHAEALIEFYKSINDSLSLGPDALTKTGLSEDAKEFIFHCREQLDGIPVKISREEVSEDRLVWVLINQMRVQCKNEITEVEYLRDDLKKERPTMLRANLYYNVLQAVKKNNATRLYYATKHSANHAGLKHSVRNRSYANLIKTNSITQFFQIQSVGLVAVLMM